MKRNAICPVCGTSFTAGRVSQKYCSAACRRYAYRHRRLGVNGIIEPGQIRRMFYCLRCGQAVIVTRQEDKRTKFCSSQCERLYWKHSKHVTSQAVPHTFTCRNCGMTVEVRDARDRRTAFCSADCRKQWFSLHRKHRKTHT